MAANPSNTTSGQEIDPATGFGTRAALLRDLEVAVTAEHPPQTLAILDLRGYYDAFGRLEGDSLVKRLAARLPDVLESTRFYRPRMTEIAVLVQAPADVAEERLAAAASALTASVGQSRIVIGFGAAQLPDEARDSKLALRIADSRHFLRKRMPRNRRLIPRK